MTSQVQIVISFAWEEGVGRCMHSSDVPFSHMRFLDHFYLEQCHRDNGLQFQLEEQFCESHKQELEGNVMIIRERVTVRAKNTVSSVLLPQVNGTIALLFP